MSDVRMCGFERRTPVGEALTLLTSQCAPLAHETVAVTECAGRVAKSDMVAAIDVPNFRRAMMDGYAVVAEDTLGATTYQPRTLRVVGDVRAGRGMPTEEVHPGEAVSITTGAPVPRGADAVLMAELSEVIDDGSVNVIGPVSPGKHIAPVGEDVRTGDRIVAAGRRLRPQDAGLLASVGIGSVDVVRQPRVRIVLTGDELLAPGAKPSGAQIVDSNSVVLSALAARDGGVETSVERLPDDASVLRDALQRPNCDVLLLSGGSSVGPEDHAPLVIAEVGEILVHGIAMRPSSPTGFGRIGDTLVFLIPGNPVSCMCAYEFFAGPAIRALGGRPIAWPHRQRVVKVASKLVSTLGRTDYMRVRLDEAGVHPIMTSGASILSSTTQADGVVIIPDACEGVAVGDDVTVLLYDD